MVTILYHFLTSSSCINLHFNQPCSRIVPLFLFVSIPSQVHYVHAILISIVGNWWTYLIYLGREENQGVGNPEPMENEEQAIQKTGENSL